MMTSRKRKLIGIGLLAQYLDQEEEEENQPKIKKIWMKKWIQKLRFNGQYENVYMEWRLSDPERYRRTLRYDN
jgi:hypothetical protein